MPIFEYQCLDCKNNFEILHLTKENKEEIICPKCNSQKYKKLISSSLVTTKNIDKTPKNTTRTSCCGGGMCMR